MEIESFAEIEEEFLATVSRLVWCAVSTIDRKDRTRMRVLHPIFEGNVGWIATGRTSHKAKHLARNPHLSLCYHDSSDPQKGFEMGCKTRMRVRSLRCGVQ